VMENRKKSQNVIQERTGRQKWGLDPLAVITLLLRNWYIFAITIAASLFVAYFYIGHTMPVYETSISVLINDTEDRPLVDNSELLQGLGLPGGMKNLENQIMVLKSRALTEKTLRELPFEIEFYLKTIRNKLPIYPETPVKVTFSDDNIVLPRDTEYTISFLPGGMFSIECKADYFPFQRTAKFNDTIKVPGGAFRIESINEEWLKKNLDQELCFIIHSPNHLINYYSSRINVGLVSREGSILRISMAGTNPAKDVDFLNKHVEGFQAISLDKKNTEAERRIRFIDDQLIGISDSLSLTENKLQQFR